MNFQQQDPVQDMEVLDSDEVPLEYRRSKAAPRDSKSRHSDTSHRSTPRDQSHRTPRIDGSDGARHSARATNSQNFIQRIGGKWLFPSPERSSDNDNFKQHERKKYKRQSNTEHPPEEVYGGDDTSEQVPISHIALEQALQKTIEGKEREWRKRERELQQRINHTNHLLEENTRMLQAKLQESEAEKLSMQEEHHAFIRKQQEASFRQMESARWLPTDEGKVMGDLDRLKRDMRSWAKAVSIKDSSLLQSLGEAEYATLMQDLANVAVVEKGQLPEGLFTAARSPMLLLNALLAHSVYTSFFRSPFFFLGNNDASAPFSARSEGILEDIYERAKEANQQDAYMWRSQTLRLLMPPLRNDALDAEKQLRHMTEDSITQAADRQAVSFLAGPAGHLIENKAKTDVINKLNKIYRDAAGLSYMLWTRRTEMKCFTLNETEDLSFDAESPYFDPDNLVRYDDHKDNLKGKMATLIVHPLLKVYGTDEAENYNQERIWAKGVVWLDSRNAEV